MFAKTVITVAKTATFLRVDLNITQSEVAAVLDKREREYTHTNTPQDLINQGRVFQLSTERMSISASVIQPIVPAARHPRNGART